MKQLSAFILTFILSTSFSQLTEVKFREKAFANGMNYPQVIIPASKKCEDSINANILLKISDLESSDFCVGQYGYVQKSTHLQIHIFASCIDMDESQNRFLLYNLDEGTCVPYSDLINPKKTAEAGSYLTEKAKVYAAGKSIELNDEIFSAITEHNLDAFQAEMTKDGIDLWLPNLTAWGEKRMTITWIELKPFLKYNFI